MIAYQQECHTEGDPKVHEWAELPDGRYRSICARWTEAVSNLVVASEITCEWCLNRQRRRAESGSQPEGKS